MLNVLSYNICGLKVHLSDFLKVPVSQIDLIWSFHLITNWLVWAACLIISVLGLGNLKVIFLLNQRIHFHTLQFILWQIKPLTLESSLARTPCLGHFGDFQPGMGHKLAPTLSKKKYLQHDGRHFISTSIAFLAIFACECAKIIIFCRRKWPRLFFLLLGVF